MHLVSRFFQRPLPLLVLACCAPFLCLLLILAWCLILPAGSTVHIERETLLVFIAVLLLTAAPAVYFAFRTLRRTPREGTRLEVLAAGLEAGDAALIQALFPNSQDVRLAPLSAGYSGASVLQAQSWGVEGTLQRSSVVKVGNIPKLQAEVENYERYVREYVGNTATLLQTAQRNKRMALRWAYAAFTGTRAQTLADYAATGAPLAPVIESLFSSRSTLGLLLGTPRRDPECMLYRDYSWNGRDWQRILAAADDLLEGQALRPDLPFSDSPLPNPLATMQRWYDPLTGSGERAQQTFDVPVTTIHGDLNSRNILIDASGAIFVIDFANTGPGSLYRDFARLETEIRLVLRQPGNAAAIQECVAQFDALLHDAHGQPHHSLRAVLQPPTSADPLLQAIVALRRQAHDYAGPWLSGPAAPYWIALLHTTLDTLRYAQCGVQSKRAALLIAAHLCQALA